MSISNQRNSLRDSSNSINVIRDSVSGLSNGIRNLRKNANKILLVTQNNNNFKRTLIKKDNDFFNKRRENVLRKQREDELEATTVTGVAKKQGNLFQQSTRGFFGRILDFLGVLLLGWALTNLPKFIAQFEKLFKLITKVVEIMGGFIKTITGFLTGIATGIGNLFAVLNRFDFAEIGNGLKELFAKGINGFVKLTKDFQSAIFGFTEDKDIRDAAEKGLQGGEISENEPLPIERVAEKDVDIEPDTDDTTGEVKIEGRADGGDVIANEPVIVGERGREIFVPETDGTIIPNQETEQMIAGVNSTPSDEEVSPESPSSLSEEEIEDESLEFVNESVDDGVEKLSGGSKKPQNNENSIIPRKELEKNITDAEKFTSKNGKNKVQEEIDEKVTPKKRKVPVLKEINNKKRTKIMVVEKAVPMGASSTPAMNKTTVASGGSGNSSVSTLLDFQSVSSLKYT